MAKTKIETELLEASGVKKKVGETFQKYAHRLMSACLDLKQDAWDEISDDAQDWVNKGAKQYNADKDIPNFPADAEEEPEDEPEEAGEEGGEEEAGEGEEPDEPEERPRRGRGRREEPEDEPEEAPRRGGRRAAKEEPDEEEERPRRGGRSSRREEPEEPEEAPRGRRRAAKEEEPEERPARSRTRAKGGDDEEADKPARGKVAAKKGGDAKGKSTAKAPAARSRKEPEGKAASATTLLKKMLIKKPRMTTDEILEELDTKHDLQPTKMAVASIASAFKHSMRVLNEAGLLDDKIAAKL